METKRCSHCGEEKPVSEFYPIKGGYMGKCKACYAAANGTVYKGKKNKHREVPDGLKWCPKCECVLPVTEFARSNKTASGYQSHCKSCRQKARPKGKQPEILPDGMKRCFNCKKVLPATTEYFSIDNRAKSGLQGRCKDCYQAYREANLQHINQQKAEYYQANREKIRRQQKIVYYANHEASIQRLRQYYRDHRDYILNWRRADYQAKPDKYKVYRESQKEWKSEYFRRYRVKHADRLREYNREWVRANPEKNRARVKQYRLAHPENVRASKKRWYKSWRAADLEGARLASRIKESRRRARKQELPDNFTVVQWNECLLYWGYRCAVCGSDQELRADHWIPLAAIECSGTIIENMICLCEHCNATKQAKHPVKWLIEKLGEDAAAQKLAEIETYFKFVKLKPSKE